METIPKSNRKIEETEVKSIPLTHQYMTAHFPGLIPLTHKYMTAHFPIPLTHKYMTAHFPGLLQTFRWKVEVLCYFYGSKTPISVKWRGHASAFHVWTTLTYNRAKCFIIKNPIILNIIHNIFKLRDIEVVIYIILVLLKSGADGLKHYLNIR